MISGKADDNVGPVFFVSGCLGSIYLSAFDPLSLSMAFFFSDKILENLSHASLIFAQV